MSNEASILDQVEDISSAKQKQRMPHGQYTQAAGSEFPPRYLCSALQAAVHMTFRDTPEAELFLIGSVKRIARWMRDQGTSPESMLIVFKSVLLEPLKWVAAKRGTDASETLRLKITGWAVDEFFQNYGDGGADAATVAADPSLSSPSM